jgi:hypothetical protein
LTCPPETDPQVKLEWWFEGSRGDDQGAFSPEADHRDAGERHVLLSAEAVEKVNPLDHFIPDFFPSSIEAKSRISDYKL